MQRFYQIISSNFEKMHKIDGLIGGGSNMCSQILRLVLKLLDRQPRGHCSHWDTKQRTFGQKYIEFLNSNPISACGGLVIQSWGTESTKKYTL